MVNRGGHLKYQKKYGFTALDHLAGEAFFEVDSHTEKPCNVEADGTKTGAMGTAFNIHAYPDANAVKVALLEGKALPHNGRQVCGTSDILHQTTTNKLSSEENNLSEVANGDIVTMSFEDEIGSLTPGKTYFARVAVLTDNTLNRYNYSPIIEIKL